MATKPTIREYDQVYAGLRPNSVPNYELLRTWILSLTSGAAGGVTDITFVDLQTLIGGSNLIPGQLYQITDFQTVQDIPGTVDTFTGPLEALIVRALSTTELESMAYSPSNPTDIIQYDIDNIEFGATLGRITYREDTLLNNAGTFDIRNQQYRRWDDGSGNFVVAFDNGNASSDLNAFGGDIAYGGVMNCIMGQYYLVGINSQVNNVIYDGNSNVVIGNNGNSNTVANLVTSTNIFLDQDSNFNIIYGGTNIQIGQAATSNEIRTSGNRITLGQETSNNIVGAQSQDVIISQGATNVTLGGQNNNVSIGQFCDTVTTGNFIIDLEIGSRSANIVLGSNVSLTAIGNQCDTINLNGQNSDIYIGHNANTITIDTNSTGITIGNDNMNHTFGTLCIDITFGNHCQDNVLAGSNRNIVMRDTVSARETISGENNTVHEANLIFYQLTYQPGVAGGTVGTYDLAWVPENASFFFGAILVSTALVSAGGTSTLGFGVSTDDPTGIDAATLQNTGHLDGNLNNADCFGTSGQWTTMATAARTIQSVVGVEDLTDGVVQLKVNALLMT